MAELFVYAACCCCAVACLGALRKPAFAESGQQAILVVSFGASQADIRTNTIDACENAIAAAFPDYAIRRAFTSNRIITLLRERDAMAVETPAEALQRLHDAGVSDVIVQPLHVIPGTEFHEIVATVNHYRTAFKTIRLGLPLLASSHDYMAVVEAIATRLPAMAANEAVVLLGHGTRHPANAAYPALERMFEEAGLARVFVGTLDGYPTLAHVARRLRSHQIETVILMPLMLMAGHHARTDMAGRQEHSWKSQLMQAGFMVDVCLHGLGEYASIQQRYVQHVRDALAGDENDHHHTA